MRECQGIESYELKNESLCVSREVTIHCQGCPGCASQGDRLTSLERSVVEEIRRDLGRQQPPHRLRAALLVIDRVAPRPGGSE